MDAETSYVALDAKSSRKHPRESANPVSLVTLAWVDPLILKGARSPLTEDDVWPLCERDTASVVHDRFQQQWQAELQAPAPNLTKALWRTFRGEIMLTVLLYFVSAGLNLLQPWVIKSIVEFLQQPTDEDTLVTSMGFTSGYGLAGLLAGLSILSITCGDFAQFLAAQTGCNVKTIFVDSVFLQTLALSGRAKQQVTSGDVVTMATVDSEKMLQGFWLGFWSLVAPAMLLVIMILVGVELGLVTGLVGGAVMLVFMVAGYFSGTRVGSVKRQLLRVQAERVKLMNEVLQGIRVVKLYAWERDIEAHVAAVRAREFELIKSFQALRVFNTVTLFAAPLLTMAVCWVTYIALGHAMSPTKAFTVMALMNTALLPCTLFSNAVMYASEAFASAQRVNKYLLLDTVAPPATPALAQPSAAEATIALDGADFAWEQEPVLRGISFQLSGPSLTIVVGVVGSGKSSFIHALLGEMNQVAGSRRVDGHVAFAAQEAWIQHDTLRNNILFADAFDSAKYERVLAACQLGPDLAMLTHGDATEIGERGINLSGGQKARVSLARALYKSDASLFLLDDPLSALDVHVAGAVFADGIRGLLRDKSTVLVLNSHYHLLPQADRVMVMDGGRIVADGPFDAVQAAFPHLAATFAASEEAPAAAKGADVEASTKTDSGLVAKEERAVGAVSVATYTSYFGSSGWNGTVVAVSVLLSYSVCQAVVVSGDLYLSHWSTTPTSWWSQGASWSYAAIILAGVVLVWGRSMYALFIAQRCAQQLHSRLFHKVLSLSVPTFFDVTPLGRVLNRFATDLDLVDAQIPFYGFMLLQFLFQIFAVLIVCAATTPYVMLLYPVMLAGFYYVVGFYNPTAGALKRMDSITRSPLVTLISEALNGLTTIRAFKMTPTFVAWNRARLDTHMRYFSTFYMSRAWFQMRLDWLSAGIIILVAFLCIALRASLGLAAAGLSLTYAAQLSAFLSKCAMFYNTVDTMMTSVERLAYYDTLEGEDGADASLAARRSADLPPQWPVHASIALQHVSMRYRENLPLVLQDVHVTFAAKEKVGICGRTGSGKSSLVSALFRLVEVQSGQIVLDGVDIATLPVQTLRSKLTIIPQDPVLFSGSLRFNLDPSGNADDAALWGALKKVQLATFVDARGGLEFEVAEKGGNLSVGQRQLLCIARALLRDTKVVVLDEATANVDVESDRLIQEAIRSCFADVTLLVIAHRLETILHCDKILVLDHGRVVEFDAPGVLQAKDGGAFQGLMQQAGLASDTE
ncbi:ATP-binding Cassette (ABC) Superfamily [Achlya hypogyna]|uniref:ATP-binding Cassette (ABC) Superfamily n=1 Tax=Achlya hypogyna TaxID=1202772 RepID=A0A1V9Z857_ACHHY|nr:ATP-binding Cassette (ABC) Superfamily [Achlya hypogyna]